MLPFQMIAGGTFSVSVDGGVASSVEVELQSLNPPDFIVARAIANGTDFTKGWGAASSARAIEWFWERSMPQYSAKGILQSSEGSTPQLPAMTSYTISSLGISHYDTSNPPTFAGLACTNVAGNTGTFVCTMSDTGTIQVGDYVRLSNVVDEQQISGYVFQVTAVSVNSSITLGYMASGGLTFASAGDSALVTKFIPGRYYPHWMYIANITKAAQAKVYFTTENDFTPGEIVSFRVGPMFGMDEINNRQIRVLSVTNSSTESSIVIDLDTSGFTTFTFPLTAEAVNTSPAVCVPSSSGVVPFNGSATIPQQPPGTNLQDAFDNRNKRLIVFGSGLFNVSGHTSTNGDVWMYQAYKYDSYNNQ